MNRSTASLARCAFSPRGTRSSAVPLLRTVQRGLATDDQGQPLGGGMFDHLQEIEVVGNSLSKSGGIVEVTARGGEVVKAQIDPILAGDAALLSKLLTQAAQDAYDQVQYEVKRKLVEVSMRDRRKQQMKERDQMAIDLEAFKEK
ncbi:uncharacterized protein ACA1_264410 [Acanthamoeba castellanii str. Neff]|uniref:Uncharacterized protein n=1 Tax=Acanthamoeba castellanii (strain ATCC 30010 / Neff) TaxID=1257118 RepID=L8H3H1_ACACF|nr:uncharacterized protein ACA1_264410 [Acanthamoeba castellanii str. Neff]ELR19268.1 hypothetical protein ACA1_264410 [Acanthamoeba castellanii str. Neff]